ncbi:MAG: S8 family peptidase [Acidobacteriia bacterium]|nr:S8 family peptidase [Methyloceanibacter sp.]MCL6492928.1 S8 family peptidase [Terriglobia bacterium]
MQVANDPQALLELRNDPASIAPERAIVFELAGTLKDFHAQARSIGLEYLGDFEDDITPSEDFHDQKKPDKAITGRIYLAMPDVRALQDLLNLWKRYRDGKNMPRGKSAWRELFDLLVDVRPWGPQDRVPPETVSFWRDALATAPRGPVRFEIELWFYEDADRRARAFDRLQREVQNLGGRIVHHVTILEIRYDAALVDIPTEHVQALIDHPDVTLARVDEVMFLRPQSAARHPGKEELEGADGEVVPDGQDISQRAPIAALLDGLPIQKHARLDGRLIMDDPDNLESAYVVDQREHGTAMASLIIHGDLNRQEHPISRPLFVLPVMQPSANGVERTPANRLLVDVIYRAVRRIKEGDGDHPATAPDVILINLSLCDEWRPFARVMSPLGRLLDYLAYRYNILFLVSAGNVLDRLTVPNFANSNEFRNATPKKREQAILSALNANKSQRTLFSPAEAMNVLTIGAAHRGSAFNGGLPRDLIDPFTDETLPNIASALGLGYRKTVKPELLFEGGRTPVRIVGTGGSVTIQPARGPARLFGAKTAFPDRRGGTRYEDFTWGTSVATALATRAGHRIHDVLVDAAGGSNHADIPPKYMPLVVKALLVHGARWGSKGTMLDSLFQPQGQGQHVSRRDDIARLLGYGVPQVERVLACTENRATLLGYGEIAVGSALRYRIPLPPDLSAIRGKRILRSLTVTLAWFSPLNPRHQGYRMAALDISPEGNVTSQLVPDRLPSQPSDKSVRRGTVLHEQRQGVQAAVLADDEYLSLIVSCRATAGEYKDPVPYAMAVSFEVPIESGIPVYDQIRARLAAPVRAAAATRS